MKTMNPSSQREFGFGTLTISVIILLLLTLVTLYTTKTTTTEQQISANQYRSDQALSVANAGLDYIIAYYNKHGHGWDKDDPTDNFDYTSAQPKTIPIMDVNGNLLVTSEAYFIAEDSGGLTVGAQGHSDDKSAIRNLSLKVTSPGLFGDDGNGTIDYPLISRNDVSITGNISVVNRFSHKTIWTGTSELNWGSAATFVKDPHYTGEWTYEKLVNADPEHSGSNYTMKASHKAGGVNSDVIYNDPNLRNLNPDSFFQNFFVDNKSAIRSAAKTNLDSNGKSQLYKGGLGWEQIANSNPRGLLWVDGDLTLSGSKKVIGSPSEPVVMVIDGNFINTGAPASISLYGVLYITGYWDTQGNMTIQGSVIVESEFGETEGGGGNPMIVFDPTLFGGDDDGGPPLYPAGVVAGTWKDWQ